MQENWWLGLVITFCILVHPSSWICCYHLRRFNLNRLCQGGRKLGKLGMFKESSEPKKTRGIIWEFCATAGKFVTNKMVSPDAIFQMQKCFKICLRLGIPDKIPEFSVLPRLPLLPLLFAAIVYEEVSLWLWRSLENLGSFYSNFLACLCFRVYRATVLHWVSEEQPDIFDSNVNKDYPILIIFGVNIPHTTCH